ncbi:FadR/GntR family transcriptional regulator [Oceanobacillus caeni]|uniref:FadR/GntR family transcriptional regulator n=1 Tax=Oceanobacillus caeni TaxID=405946 RepID=UPI00195A702C
MEFKPIQKRKRIYEIIVQQIKDAVANGTYRPGDKLPSERVFAEMLGVSRTSVKEAVTVLESSGIISVKPGVGMFISQDSEQKLLFRLSQILEENDSDFMHLIELRQAIEGDAAYYAASRMTGAQRERLYYIYLRLLEKERMGEIALKEDFEFHCILIEAANNPVMLQVVNLVADQIQETVQKSREFSTMNRVLNLQVMSEHAKIYESIMNKDPNASREAMWEHHQGIKERHQQSHLYRMEE